MYKLTINIDNKITSDRVYDDYEEVYDLFDHYVSMYERLVGEYEVVETAIGIGYYKQVSKDGTTVLITVDEIQ